jgi:ABC-type amino acid transport substrate-binding protein
LLEGYGDIAAAGLTITAKRGANADFTRRYLTGVDEAVVRKNNPELKTSLNRFLKTHKKGTLLENIYFNEYYKKIPGSETSSAIERKRRYRNINSSFCIC